MDGETGDKRRTLSKKMPSNYMNSNFNPFPGKYELKSQKGSLPPTGLLAKAHRCSFSCSRVAGENAEFPEIWRKKGRGGGTIVASTPPPQQQGEEELLK
jgi:hypothetical protein